MAYTVKAHGSTLPSTNFATRKLGFFKIALSGIETNYANVGSTFQLAIQGVQQIAELYAVGTPDSGNVIVVLSLDTITSDGSSSVTDMIDAAVTASAGGSVTVTQYSLIGGALA
jgi:hypothetical protein